MNEKLEKIKEYFSERGMSEDEFENWIDSSVYLAMLIAIYAHRDQKRENGEDYVNHPLRCLTEYRMFIGIGPEGRGDVDTDLLYECGIPFDGVQEVCLLHDVVEDTEFTFEDVRDIYYECGFERFFNLYISDALQRITHDKSVPYPEYIDICIQNPISAIVKMFDLQDNLRVIDLAEFNNKNKDRARRYLEHIFAINQAYRFIENIGKYREEFEE